MVTGRRDYWSTLEDGRKMVERSRGWRRLGPKGAVADPDDYDGDGVT